MQPAGQPTVPSLFLIINEFINSRVDASLLATAKRILTIGYVTYVSRTMANKSITFRVRHDTGIQSYDLNIIDYYTPRLMRLLCNCGENGLCRHKVAGLLYIAERLTESRSAIPEELMRESQAGKPMPMNEVEIVMLAINFEVLNKLSSSYEITAAQSIVNYKKVEIVKAEKMTIEAEVNTSQTLYKVSIRKSSETAFTTYCNCYKKAPAVCEHRYAVFMSLYNQHGKFYFETFKDFTAHKRQQLAEYGYSLDDVLDDKFEFVQSTSTGHPELRAKDPSLKKLSQYQNWDAVVKQLKLDEKTEETADIDFQEIPIHDNHCIGFYINFSFNYYPYFTLSAFTAKLSNSQDEPVHPFKAFAPHDPPVDMVLNADTKKILQLLQEISNEQLLKLTQKEVYSRYKSKPELLAYYSFSPAEQALMNRHIHGRMMQAFPLLEKESFTYHQSYPGKISNYSLSRVQFSGLRPKLAFRLGRDDHFLILSIGIKTEENVFEPDVKFYAGMFAFSKNKVYLLNHLRDARLIQYMGKSGNIKVNKKDTLNFIRSLVIPLQHHYDVEVPEDIMPSIARNEEAALTKLVYLSEKNDKFLIIRPAFRYGDRPPVAYGDATRMVEEQYGHLYVTEREHEVETAFVECIRELHPSFQSQGQQGFFHISFEDAMEEGWFFGFYNKMKDEEAEVYGMKDMKKFHYNPHPPVITFGFGSGIDWFDVKINIMYGDKSVKLKELRKAVIGNRNYVLLDDGSIGMLPEEWAMKYSMLFKMGNVDKEELKIPKFHFSIIDEMFDQIDDDKIKQELEYKRNMLRKFSRIEDIEMPEKVDAQLRPYQKSGFSWFNFLDEFNWGGILADDMGLGKTLQTLTFLQYLKNKRESAYIENETPEEDRKTDTHLIICPNSLMFNWESEIAKFCPDLTYHIHHGSERFTNAIEFAAFDIIITTYGTIRSDFEIFVKFLFRYIILDESQAIKNPASKATKAVQLLKSRNRLALSGTPLQNNIYDLYAQLNFLNPGMLGNMEFFKNEYAIPIEKHQDAAKKEELKKLIFPFFLRRTKAQVVEELPEKTETVLYCEMGEEQRQVYEAYRQEYRDRIMRKIATDGLEKSGIYVLQGLMKLRQVCDSPDILGNDELYSHESVKLEELTREITENTGEHKVLVFSQFLGMLRLIRQRMDLHGINYAYLDGSSTNRKESVEKFQNDENCKVFLISLKAGGVGLNLTAADYVYLVDPWWNPATEQQAIDRTHRIGQSRNVFAYKMICKNTIEEKILLLQNKKKDLAKELITEEKSFVKVLSKEDIEYLFA